MKNSTAQTPAIPPIEVEAGANFFQQKLGGVKLVLCLFELIKNCFDWKASKILVTIEDTYIQVIDNGSGMTAANRNAFCSMAKTTGGQSKQTSKFGTGSKDMLYISNGVTVVTRTDEGPEIIEFSLSTADYQNQLFAHEKITPRILREDQWNLGIPTGTILHYDFKGLSSVLRKLKKPGDIASELAQKLPQFAMNAILFNGEPLPKKQIMGQSVLQSFFTEELGEVSIELYTLKGGAGYNEGVFLSSTGFSEVSMASFRNQIPEHLRPHIPEVFLNTRGISGTITCQKLFGQYIQDGRTSFKSEIADSELIAPFIQLLVDKENEVKTILGLNEPTEVGSVQDLMDKVLELSEKIHGEELENPPPPENPREPKPSEPQALNIHGTARDYQVGEKVVLTAEINSELCDVVYKDILWLTTNSGLRDITISPDNKTLTGIADQLDWRTVSIKAGIHTTQTNYRIVSEKVMYLSAQRINKPLLVGEAYELNIYNIALAAKPIVWKVHKGEASLASFGERLGKAKIMGTEQGEVVITVESVYEDGRIFKDACTIPIIRPETRLVKILDHKFKVFCQKNQSEKAIRMARGGGDPKDAIHHLYANNNAKMWQLKDAKKTLFPTLLLIGQEYARFLYEDILEREPEGGQTYYLKLEQIAEEVVAAFTKGFK